jgi:hypothetical protein
MDVAYAAGNFVAMVARAADTDADKIGEGWLSSLPSRVSLTTGQIARLRARLAWLVTQNITLTKARRQLGDVTEEEREFCAWSATVAACAAGTVSKPQIAVLEAIYDRLGLSKGALYAGLHARIGATAATADEPVPVRDGGQEVLHPIPPPPADTDQVSDRLARIRAETERVAAMLADIFVDDEPPQAVGPSGDEGILGGLDAAHVALLTWLLARPEWSRQEFDSVAAEAGLMPGGAMETINEWAFDRYDDAVIEDGDPIMVNGGLLQGDLATITVE